MTNLYRRSYSSISYSDYLLNEKKRRREREPRTRYFDNTLMEAGYKELAEELYQTRKELME